MPGRLAGSGGISGLYPFGGLGQTTGVAPAGVMLQQHYPDRAALAREAGSLQRGEEQTLLLGVMKRIGEGADVVHHGVEIDMGHGVAALQAIGDVLEDNKHDANVTVLGLEHFGGSHGPPPGANWLGFQPIESLPG